MNRWIQLSLVTTLLLLAALSTSRYSPGPTSVEEVLVYEVTADRGIRLPFPALTEGIIVTSWLEATGKPTEGVNTAYTLQLQLVTDDRVTKNMAYTVLAAATAGEEAVQVDGADVHGSQSLSIDVDDAEKGGELRITAPELGKRRVYLSAARQLRRGLVARVLKQASLGREALMQLSRESGSLSYFDLPEDLRSDAVATRARRLTAAGIAGTDYRQGRLVVQAGSETGPPRAASPPPRAMTPGVWSAFTFTELDELHVDGPPGTRLELAAGPQSEFYTLPARGRLELALSIRTPQSVLIRVFEPVALRVSIPTGQRQGALLRTAPLEVDGRLYLTPDTIHRTAYTLSPEEPLRYELREGQTAVALSLRVLDPERRLGRGRVNVIFQGGPTDEPAVTERFEAERSAFAHFQGIPTTEARSGQIRIPRGATRMLLTGDPSTAVSVSMVDYPATENRLPEAYDNAEQRTGRHFSPRPYEESRWSSLRPRNGAQLDDSRRAHLELTVHLEQQVNERGTTVVESLVPLEYQQQRFVFEPTTYAPNFQWPDSGWVLLDGDHPTVQLEANATQRVEYWYRSGSDGIGDPLDLVLNGQIIAHEAEALTTGQSWLTLSRGTHELGFSGLGQFGAVLVKAQRATAGRIVRRRRAFANSAGVPLRFNFAHGRDEPTRITLIVTSAQGAGVAVVRYQIDGGRLPDQDQLLSRGLSDTQGQLNLKLGARGTAWLWSTDAAGPEAPLEGRQAALTLHVTDDLPPGDHQLTVDVQRAATTTVAGRAEPLYVRAFVSRNAPAESATPQTAIRP